MFSPSSRIREKAEELTLSPVRSPQKTPQISGANTPRKIKKKNSFPEEENLIAKKEENYLSPDKKRMSILSPKAEKVQKQKLQKKKNTLKNVIQYNINAVSMNLRPIFNNFRERKKNKLLKKK